MIQRLALLVGGIGAAAVLAFALGLTNFVFAGPGAALNAADSQPVANTADAAAVGNGQPGAGDQSVQPQKKTVVDKVYIAPTPAPKVVHVNPKGPSNQPSTTTPANQRPHAAAPRQPASWESEHEGNRGGGHGRGDD